MSLPTWAELQAMTDDQIIAGYDAAARNTVSGLNYFRDELDRRLQDRQNNRMMELTAEMHAMTGRMEKLTASMQKLTWAAVVVAIIGVVLTAVTIFKGGGS